MADCTHSSPPPNPAQQRTRRTDPEETFEPANSGHLHLVGSHHLNRAVGDR